MRDHQSQQPTERMGESTIERSQQTMERLIDLQRNMAEMTLSALEWGESAQRQGLELTQSMLESAPGPQFTESMMERYLEGMEAIVPEMEQAMAEGTRAVTTPGMPGADGTGHAERAGGRTGAAGRRMEAGTGRSSGRPRTEGQRYQGRQGGERGRTTEERRRPTHRSMGEPPSQQPMDGHRSTQQPMGEQRRSPPQPMAGRGSNRRQRDRQASSDRSQSRQPQRSAGPGEEYPETGEWVTPREYGGESTGTAEYQQRPLSAAPNPSSAESERDYQRGRDQPGRPTGSGDRSRGAREGHRPTEGERSEPGPGQTEQGRLREQYAQRIDPDRSGADRVDAGRGEDDDRGRSPERRAMEGTDVTAEQPQQPTETPTDELPEEE